MKKLLILVFSISVACIWFSSCKDQVTYAELVENEKDYIKSWINSNPYDINFGHIITKDEEWINNITDDILSDSIHPCKYIELNQWYTLKEGNFKRLYFCIHNWGKDGVTDYSDEEQLKAAMKNKKKFYSGQNALIRYDSLFLISEFDYENPGDNTKGNNLLPLSFQICYNWNPYYYSNSYYGYSYGTGSSYECTSGGVGFPVRFLWQGGEASIICPFSLVETQYSSYYYTMYYGNIQYNKPNYLPQ